MTEELQDIHPVPASRKYPHAPITEAIIEIRVIPKPGVSATTCANVFDEVRATYPQKRETFGVHAEIRTGAEIGALASQRKVGYSWLNAEGTQSVTAWPDRYAFSRLAPYESWEAFCPEARRLWDIFRARLAPEKIVRIATRFVNRIEVPAPTGEIADAIATASGRPTLRRHAQSSDVGSHG